MSLGIKADPVQLNAYAEGMGISFTPWEFHTLLRMFGAYRAFATEAHSPDCFDPTLTDQELSTARAKLLTSRLDSAERRSRNTRNKS